MSKKKKNPHWGSTLDDFLDEEGVREATKTEAVTRVVAWQLREEMKRQGLSKAKLAEQMKTSRAQG
jgi:antitoxin HicB